MTAPKSKRDRDLGSEINPSKSLKSPRLFKEVYESKVSKEEKYLITAFRNIHFEKIKQDLGDDYNDQDAETVFQLLIKELKENGTIKKIIDDYLAIKIQQERDKFNSECQAKPHK